MKRDLDLIRILLAEIEKNNDPTKTCTVRAEGYAPVVIAYHLKLLKDGGLVVARDCSTESQMDYRPKSLTWAGHEFLDAVRNETIWRQVMAKLKDQGLEVPFSLIQQLATKFGASMLGLGNGA